MENKIKYHVFLLVLMLVTFGCRNYESKKYISIENDAIKEIIPQLVDLDAMLVMNNLCNADIKMYLISNLEAGKGNEEDKIEESEIEKDFYRLSKEENEVYERERQHFKPFINKIIKERTLDIEIEYTNYPNLEIVLIDKDTFHKEDKFSELNDKNTFGALFISRIIFNRNFDTAYLSYAFFCGDGCAWSYNIEIKRNNGRWKISETFSGGIA